MNNVSEILVIIILISYIFSQYCLLRWMKTMGNYQAHQDRAIVFLLSEGEKRAKEELKRAMRDGGEK